MTCRPRASSISCWKSFHISLLPLTKVRCPMGEYCCIDRCAAVLFTTHFSVSGPWLLLALTSSFLVHSIPLVQMLTIYGSPSILVVALRFPLNRIREPRRRRRTTANAHKDRMPFTKPRFYFDKRKNRHRNEFTVQSLFLENAALAMQQKQLQI